MVFAIVYSNNSKNKTDMQTIEMLNKDFFSITDFCGEKSVHIHGYFYNAGGSVTDDENEEYRVVDFTGLIIPIAEFIAEFAERGYEYIDEIECDCNQYIGDLTEEGVRETFENYYTIQCFSIPREQNVPFNPLHFSAITEDTPYGHYINA